DEERIFLEYASEDRDTAKIKKEIIKLQNKLYQDTARFCIIYLDTSFRPYFNPWEYFQNDTGKFASETRKLILSFSSNGQEVIDSINTIQDRYSSADFQLCTAKVLSLREVSNQKDGKCGIGKVSLSKVFLEKSKDRGILYCNFYCGGLCGYGSILIIEKQNGRWKIIEQRITRIS
ncbi:MAG TPA: hypothetical protein PLD84_10590, partial [Chitinophagales bacterium]|nr:hypothetical protein [Chitinophagales bacterium]